MAPQGTAVNKVVPVALTAAVAAGNRQMEQSVPVVLAL
jgi:hypothetical protein